MQTVRGFTLIELMVVISITALVGILAFANSKDFTQDQILKKAVGQIQTYLRLAQANATAGVLCNNQGGADWRVKFDTNIGLECSTNNFVNTSSVKTLTLENVKIDSVQGSSCSSASNPLLYVTYSKLNGGVKMTGSADCINSSSQVLVNIKNLKTEKIKPFTISKGGAIDVQ